MKATVSSLTILMFPLPVAEVQAHGGGLDAYGCHHDQKCVGYRCHRGPLAGRAFASKDEMLRVLKKQEASRPTPRTPVPPAPQATPRR